MSKNDGINFAIVSFNEGSSFSQLWPFVSKCWKQVCNITPVAFEISSIESDFVQSEFGLIKKVKALEEFSVVFQSQLLRFYGIKYLQANNADTCIITDADMLPISSSYINTGLNFYTKDHIVSYNKDLCSEADQEIPVCYNLSSVNFFKKFFMLDDFDSFWDFLKFLSNKYLKEYNTKNIHKHQFGWNIDQRFLFDQSKLHADKFVGLKLHSQINFKRLCRETWPKPLNFDDISSGMYTDCHFHNSFSTLTQSDKALLTEIINHSR